LLLGIADPLRFPEELADRVLCIIVNLCIKYDFDHVSQKGEITRKKTKIEASLNKIMDKALETCNRHVPLFHPKVTLWDEYFSNVRSWKEVETMYLSQQPDDRFDPSEKDTLKKTIQTMNSFFQNKYKVAPVFDDVNANQFVYQQIQLYFSPQDNTVMLLVRHALSMISKSISEV
jgi:hypothetical protein